MNWLKRNWKGIATGLCGVASVSAAFIPGAGGGLAVGVGAVCTMLTATHVLEARAVAKAEAKAKELGQGMAGVVDELERLKGKKP